MRSRVSWRLTCPHAVMTRRGYKFGYQFADAEAETYYSGRTNAVRPLKPAALQAVTCANVTGWWESWVALGTGRTQNG